MNDLFSAWVRVLTKPSEESFRAEEGKESLGKAVLGVFIAGLVGSLVTSFLLVLHLALRMNLGIFQMSDPSLARSGAFPVIPGLWLGIGYMVATPIFSVIALFIFAGISHALARAFGGTGTFTRIAYYYSLAAAPLSIVISLLNWIPCLGTLVSLALSIYMMVLYVLAIKAAYGLTTNKAIGVFAIWVLIVLLFSCCIGAGVVVAIMGSLQSGASAVPRGR